jgi:hypothetical protein
MREAAASFMVNLSPEVKEQLMISAMETVLEKTISSYQVESAIRDLMKDDVLAYVHEYLADLQVQEHLKNIAHDRVEELFSAVIASVDTDLRKNMKSQYMNFEAEHNG